MSELSDPMQVSKNNEKSSNSVQDASAMNKSRDEIRFRSRSSSSDGDSHRHLHKHRGSERRSKHRHRHSGKERRKRRTSSERRKSDSRGKRSRSRDSSPKRISRSKEKRSSHRSSKHRHRPRSPVYKSRSPRRRTRSSSPPPAYDRAMDAQERLARRLERAKDLMKRKEEHDKKEKEKESQRISGLSPSNRIQEAVKRATEMISNSTVNTSYEGMSAKATAQIEALRAKAFAETGIEVPSYYNPLAINPMNYAQQAAKRKKLWAKNDDAARNVEKIDQSPSTGINALWSGVKFGDDKSNEKFAKLMGIKSDQMQASDESHEIIKKQAEVFQNLDMQYQQARIATHTQRGLGLGFSSTMIDPNVSTQPKAAPATTR